MSTFAVLVAIVGALLAAAAGCAIKRGEFGWGGYFAFLSLYSLVMAVLLALGEAA